MFNRKLLGLLASLYFARADSFDACASPCGSAANSSNPYGDMNKLLQSGSNCATTYAPLAPQMNQYGYGGDSCAAPGYYPQQMSRDPNGYSQASYPGMGGTSAPPMGINNNNAGKDEECEVTTSIECKPRRGGQNFVPPTYSYGPSSAIQMNNVGTGSPTTRPFGVPGSSQPCDCSQFTGGMPNNYSYPPAPQSLGNNVEGCSCSQFSGQGGASGQPSFGNNTPSTGGNFLNQSKPIYCGNNGGNGGRGPFDTGYTERPGSGSVFDSFDCSKPQTYQLPPVKTAIIGTSELPISDSLRVTASSCGPAPCL